MFKNTYNYRNKIILLSAIQVLLLIVVLVWSVITGQYPLTLKSLLSGDTMSIMVFKRLRLPRALMGVIGGFGLSISGYIYQLIFKNPLASPDIVGVSSGASAGAALAIVAVSASVPFISISAFIGAVTALIITLLTAYLVPGRNSYTIVLAGIAIHSVAQTILMFLKLAADPEKQLASIEYWIMGSAVTAVLREAGCDVTGGSAGIVCRRTGRLTAPRPIRTAPYPGFPTDAQAILMAALLRCRGAAVFEENLFSSRYRHVDELARMGADIRVSGRTAVVLGVERLHGAAVRCTDLRGGAALCAAALAAEGETAISDITHIDRGYQSIEDDLAALGADIRRVEETASP